MPTESNGLTSPGRLIRPGRRPAALALDERPERTFDDVAALGQVDFSDPRASAILLRPSSTAAHPVVALPAGSPAHDALLRWIDAGDDVRVS
jgi:hypothetical protein